MKRVISVQSYVFYIKCNINLVFHTEGLKANIICIFRVKMEAVCSL
jgi:hypothetical protein